MQKGAFKSKEEETSLLVSGKQGSQDNPVDKVGTFGLWAAITCGINNSQRG